MNVTRVSAPTADEQSLIEAGIPAVFAGAIGAHWIGGARGVVLALTPERGARETWSDWGRRLSGILVPTGAYVGLCLDGQLPPEIPMTLLAGVYDAGGVFQADLRVMAREHPAQRGRLSSNTSWVSFHHALERAWIDRLWDTIDRRWLNAGADLLLAAYATDVISEIQWDEALTLDAFGRTLARSSGWALPLSDTPSFLVGAIPQSAVYAALLSAAGESKATGGDGEGMGD